MKINTPEISWHSKEAVYSIDIQPKQDNQPHRLATAGIDSNVRIWELKPGCKTGVVFLSNLSRHERAVNVVRFSKCGLVLASGGDDGTIVLWKLNERTDVPNIFDDESDIGRNLESWSAHKVLRGHLEDVNDLSWSADGNYLISGSIDHTAIIWDITKSSKLHILSEAKHFIHGVSFDPLGDFVATLSGDRSMRIYSLKTKKVIHNTSKMVYPRVDEDEIRPDKEESQPIKMQRMFHDESVVRRRLSFTPDGSLLVVPAGCLNRKQGDQNEQINTAYVFSRNCFSKPAAVLPGFKQPVTVVRCCPVKFKLRVTSDNNSDSVVKNPYRLVFAVASADTVIMYDSQTLQPFSVISNVHYAAITDLTWSNDARQLAISSRDGFCTIVTFEKKELGEVYEENLKTEVVMDSTVNHENMMIDNERKSEKTTSKVEKEDHINNRVVKNVTDIETPKSKKAVLDVTPCTITTNETKTNEKKTSDDQITVEKPNDLLSESKNSDKVTDDCEKMDTSSHTPSISLPQEKRSRRVELTTISPCPVKNKSRRVQLTTISTPEKPVAEAPLEVFTPKTNTPKITKKDNEKRTPRRIQLTAVKI